MGLLSTLKQMDPNRYIWFNWEEYVGCRSINLCRSSCSPQDTLVLSLLIPWKVTMALIMVTMEYISGGSALYKWISFANSGALQEEYMLFSPKETWHGFRIITLESVAGYNCLSLVYVTGYGLPIIRDMLILMCPSLGIWVVWKVIFQGDIMNLGGRSISLLVLVENQVDWGPGRGW